MATRAPTRSHDLPPWFFCFRSKVNANDNSKRALDPKERDALRMLVPTREASRGEVPFALPANLRICAEGMPSPIRHSSP